jgi:hypothetical protein
MTRSEHYIVFPEGDVQEIGWRLSMSTLVDLNGRELDLPLPSPRIIAYRVCKIRSEDQPGIEAVYYHLELVGAWELIGYSR